MTVPAFYLHSMNNFFLKLFHFYQDIRSPVFFSKNWRKSCNVPDFVLKQFSILGHVPLDLKLIFLFQMLKSDTAQNAVSNHQGEEPNMGEDEGEEAPDANQAF